MFVVIDAKVKNLKREKSDGPTLCNQAGPYGTFPGQNSPPYPLL